MGMELLLGCGAVSTSVRAAEDEAAKELWLETPDECGKASFWKRSSVAAIFDAEADLGRVAQIVQQAFDLEELPALVPDPVTSRDWVTHVQQLWQPLPLGSGFEVRLPWHEDIRGTMEDSRRVILQLEGGAAFGLGDHPTTQAACRFLERVVPQLRESGRACRVLDYGTGSGVLAMCAASLGAGAVVGVDCDVPSIASARRSLPLNDAPWPVSFDRSPLAACAAVGYVEQLVGESNTFDVVVANILRGPLIELEPALAAAAAPGAWLGLTGLREELGDGEAIRNAYGVSSGDFEAFRTEELEGGWLFIEARRCRDPAS